MVDGALAAYLERKRAGPRTGDLLTDIGAGWDMHTGFGVENPVLYALACVPFFTWPGCSGARR